MRNPGIIWGTLLIFLGTLLMLNRLGLLPVSVWLIFWPVALILFGLWILLGAFRGGRARDKTEHLAVQLKGYEEAEVSIRYGAGRLVIGSAAAPDELLNGSFRGGVEHHLQSDDQIARVALSSPFNEGWGWWNGRERSWDISLNADIPLDLILDTGAAETSADLTATQTRRVALRTGAGSTDITLPAAAGLTEVTLEGGAGDVTLRVPVGVAARIEGSVVVGELKVDRDRFSRTGQGFQSADYETAMYRTHIMVKFGAGQVEIR